MELVEQFFEKYEGELVFLDREDSLEEQYSKTIPEIAKVIELTDPTLEKKHLRINRGKVDKDEKGFVEVELTDMDTGNEYVLWLIEDRFNKASYVLSRISSKECFADEELMSNGIDSLENSRLKNSEVIDNKRILKGEYLALSIGNEWFTSENPLFREGLNRTDRGIVFNKLFLD